MRLLVVSDSHGNAYNLRNAVMRQPGADMIIHLGDGQSDYESVILGGEKKSVFVRGNCDYNSKYPALMLFEAEGKRVIHLMLHFVHSLAVEFQNIMTVLCHIMNKIKLLIMAVEI